MLNWLLGKPVTDAVTAIGGVIDELHTSGEEKAQADAVMERLRQEPGKLQAAINQIEAQHRTIFVAGARPFILWVCGVGLANTFLINPWLQWLTGEPGPTLPTDVISELVLALLGLGVMRSWEKDRGRAK